MEKIKFKKELEDFLGIIIDHDTYFNQILRMSPNIPEWIIEANLEGEDSVSIWDNVLVSQDLSKDFIIKNFRYFELSRISLFQNLHNDIDFINRLYSQALKDPGRNNSLDLYWRDIFECQILSDESFRELSKINPSVWSHLAFKYQPYIIPTEEEVYNYSSLLRYNTFYNQRNLSKFISYIRDDFNETSQRKYRGVYNYPTYFKNYLKVSIEKEDLIFCTAIKWKKIEDYSIIRKVKLL